MDGNLTKVQIKERNEKFIRLQNEWKVDGNKRKWDEMWTIAYECLFNTLKKKAGGKRNDLEELAMDGTVILMNRLKNGTTRTDDYRVKYLPTCMHFISLKLLYNPQQQFDDKLESLEEYEERNEWDNKE